MVFRKQKEKDQRHRQDIHFQEVQDVDRFLLDAVREREMACFTVASERSLGHVENALWASPYLICLCDFIFLYTCVLYCFMPYPQQDKLNVLRSPFLWTFPINWLVLRHWILVIAPNMCKHTNLLVSDQWRDVGSKKHFE